MKGAEKEEEEGAHIIWEPLLLKRAISSLLADFFEHSSFSPVCVGGAVGPKSVYTC